LLSLLCFWGLALALALTPARSPAQNPLQNPFKGGRLPPEGTDKLNADYNKEQRALIKDLEEGRIEAGKGQAPTIDLLAKWYTYRLTWEDEVLNRPGVVNTLFIDLENEFGKASRSEITQSFRQMFARDLAKNAREVLQNRLPIVRVNAARVLLEAAPTREPEVANVLIEVVENPAHNLGTKYWAFKGLQEFLAPGGRMPPPPFKDQALPDRIALALLGWLGQKMPVTDATPQDQVDGLRAVRREAIHALGLTQAPAVFAGGKDKGKLVGRTAQVLLRVVRREGFAPEPRWDEQIEAAIGVGWLQSKFDPAYQPDYAAYNAAYAVLMYATKYADEKATPGDRGWRYYSSRLAEAFENLQRDVARAYPRDKELVGYVTDLARQATAVLRLIETRGEARAADFEQWLQAHPPKSDTVYKGVADSKVTPGEATEK
jgi:hypothetical protein